jgi:hypothetical protein
MLLDPDPHSQYRSGSAFPIRIRIQDSQINVDPCGSGSTTLLHTLTEREIAPQYDLVSGDEPVLLLRLVPLYDHGGGGEGTDLHVARRGSRTCINTRPARLYTSSKLIFTNEKI